MYMKRLRHPARVRLCFIYIRLIYKVLKCSKLKSIQESSNHCRYIVKTRARQSVCMMQC